MGYKFLYICTMVTREIHKRRISSYPRPRHFKMAKAYFDIHGYTDSNGIDMMIKFFFSQFSDHEQKKLIDRFEELD